MGTNLFDANTQAIAWIKQQYDLGTLLLKPPFQRKPVWTARNKCAVIETILMGWPVPEIYIQGIPSKSGNMTYAIVDGQQRIRSVLQFIGSERDADELQWNGFTLDKLKPDSRYLGTSFAEMTDDQKKEFFGYRFTVRWIYTEDDEIIRSMFVKLNMFSMPLKPQELRNSMFLGPFLKLSEKLADDEYWATNRIISPSSIRRMGDIEFISDLLIGLIHGPQGGSAKIIDEYYQRYEDYDDEFPDQPVIKDLFSRTLDTIQSTLPDIDQGRWRNKNDFYSIFVALGSRLRSAILKPEHQADLEAALISFGDEVDKIREDENAAVSAGAKRYFDAVEKGANDKSRRGERHLVLEDVLRPEWFLHRRKSDAAPIPTPPANTVSRPDTAKREARQTKKAKESKPRVDTKKSKSKKK